MEPRGATEIQHELLEKHVDKDLLSKFQICTSIPGKIPLDPKKINILWQKNSWDQPNLQSFFRNKERHDEYDWYVFNSHWNYEKFRYFFQIPEDKSIVIKNGASHFPKRKIHKQGDPIRIIHHCTPWRGLNVLLRAWELLRPANCELHVFSSTKIYGQQFDLASGNQYDYLYEKCNSLKGVVYRGMTDNAVLRGELSTFDILAYPSTFEETSCISVIDALSAGLKVVCSNIGALPETTEGWAEMYSFVQDNERHAQIFASKLSEVIAKYKRGDYKQELQNQVNVYGPKWSWNQREKEWLKYLDSL